MYLFVGAVMAVAAGCYYENNCLSTSRIIAHKNIKEKIKILQLSDLHSKEFGKNNKILFNKIIQEKPDLVVLTGDLIDCSSKKFNKIVNFISSINKIIPTFYIPGNHETRAEKYDEILENLYKKKVNVLINEIKSIKIKGETINILGLVENQGTAEAYVKRMNGEYKYEDNSLLFKDLEKSNGIKIVLCHYPENFMGIGESSYNKYNFDLMFSGHAHGGQFRLPFVGGLYAPGQGILPKYTAGVHSEANKNLIISRGLGNSGFPLRLFNRPEIVTVTIK